MTYNKALDALNLYLDGDIDLDALEERIIPLAWDTEFEDQDLIDLVSIEIAYINDGISDDAIFKARIADIVASRRDIVIAINDISKETQVVKSFDNNSVIHITYVQPKPIIDYRFEAQFSS